MPGITSELQHRMQKRKNDRNGRRLRAQGGAPRPPPPEEPRQSLNKDNCHWGAGLRHCWMLLLGPDKQGHRGGHTCGGMGSSPDAVEKAKGGVSLDPGCAIYGRRLVLASAMA